MACLGDVILELLQKITNIHMQITETSDKSINPRFNPKSK